MDTVIADLESGLKEQLASLTDTIRELEDQILRNKEGYLKVQGAIEILNVLKQRQVDKANEQAKKELTVQGVD
jgi:hypothetical protein